MADVARALPGENDLYADRNELKGPSGFGDGFVGCESQPSAGSQQLDIGKALDDRTFKIDKWSRGDALKVEADDQTNDGKRDGRSLPEAAIGAGKHDESAGEPWDADAGGDPTGNHLPKGQSGENCV